MNPLDDTSCMRTTTTKRDAKNTARAIIKIDLAGQSRPVTAIVEKLDDEYPEFRGLSYQTIIGAVRSAARSLGRMSKDGQRIEK